jgi:two-component system cell cycle sensor histidine kinase/response regulator CckA
MNAALQRKLNEAEQMIRALISGEVDALLTEAGATPVLLHAAQARLRANEQLLRAVFDGAMDAMLIVDEDGRAVDANTAACVLFGLARERLLGRRVTDFRDPEPADAELDEVPAAGDSKERYLALRRPDGGRRDTEYRTTPGILPGMSLAVLRDITDRRRTESRFRTMIEKSHDGIALINATGKSIYVSKAVERIFDRTASVLEGASSTEFAHPDDRTHVAAALERLIAAPRAPAYYEFRALHADDSIRWVEVTARNFLDDPAIAAIVGNFRDITEHKAAQAALEASQRRLEDAQAMAHLGNWTSRCAPDSIISWSAECARIFGYAPGTAPRIEELFELVHLEDRQRVRTAWERCVAERAPFESEHRLVLASGETRWVFATMRTEDAPLGSPDSVRWARAGLAPYRAVGVVQDITERKRALDELRASELRYRRIVDNTSEGVWMYDASNITTFMNPRMTEMLGCSLADALGESIFSFMDEGALAQARVRVERRKRGVTDRGEFRLKRRDGADLWVSMHADPLFDQAGKFESALALVTDITERRRADEARNRLASIVESSADAIISGSTDGVILTWNGGAEKLTLYTADEAIGKPISILYPPERSAGPDPGDEVDDGPKPEQLEMVLLRKDGSQVDVSITSSVLKDDEGVRIGVSIIARDISERRRAERALRRSEEQLRQAQKLEAIGSLAGGIAHDFNNLLSVILSYTSLMVDDLQVSDPLHADLLEVQTAGMRASRLVRQLLAFSRQQMLQPVVLDLSQVVLGIKVMLLRLMREDILLSLVTSPLAGKIHADPGQIEQVIMNLVVNARDAMPHGGTLSIETTNVVIDEAHARAHPGVTAGPHVLLAVTDTGIGMDEATKSRIFEPFFTTKEKDQGTGLGLSTVYGIVQQSGGHLLVESEPGKGTTFNVYLPRTDRALEPLVASLGPAVDAGGTETILLVEDEEQVRSIMRHILRKQGYNVLEAQNAGEAFLLCEQFSDKIHLLLTDVVMPRMSGRRLAERLVQGRPEMRVLYVSGYTDDTMVHHGVAGAGVQFLQKPILPASLSRKVRHVLDAPAHQS